MSRQPPADQQLIATVPRVKIRQDRCQGPQGDGRTDGALLPACPKPLRDVPTFMLDSGMRNGGSRENAP